MWCTQHNGWGWEHSMALSSRVSRFNYHLHIPPICFQILMNSFYICKSCVWTNPFMLKRKFGFLILMISHTGIWTREPLFGILFQHMKLKRIYKCNINLHFLKTWRKLLRRLCNEKNLILLVIFKIASNYGRFNNHDQDFQKHISSFCNGCLQIIVWQMNEREWCKLKLVQTKQRDQIVLLFPSCVFVRNETP